MPVTLDQLAAEWGRFSGELAADKRVLVVEDDPTAGMVFTKVLEYAGHVTTLVASGEEALKVCAGETFPCMVVDKNLPGISGLEVIRRVHEQDRDCEAVLITAYVNLDSVLEAIDLRTADYLIKPLDSIDVLSAAVAKGVRRRNRRLLSRRMLGDLRQAVRERARGGTVAELEQARQRIDKYQEGLATKRRVLIAKAEAAEHPKSMKALIDLGFTVYVEPTGAEALLRTSRHGVSVIIISDNYDGLSGLELVEKVVEGEGRPELIFISPHAGLSNALKAVERGASAFLVKPLRDPRVLTRAVEQACRSHHERLVQFKMVQELTGIVRGLERVPERRLTRDRLQSALDLFDVKTTPDLELPLVEPDDWDDT